MFRELVITNKRIGNRCQQVSLLVSTVSMYYGDSKQLASAIGSGGDSINIANGKLLRNFLLSFFYICPGNVLTKAIKLSNKPLRQN